MKKFWSVVGTLAAWMLPIVIMSFNFYQCGKTEGHRERDGECYCGATRTCAFGPGIVGEQHCTTSVVTGNTWTRCEPAPVKEGK